MKRDNLGWIGLCALVGALTACDGGETADAGLDAAMDARVPDATAPDSATPDAGHDASTDAGPSLGGIGAIAVATKHEIVLGIVGGIFVVEALSVIIQVLYFKRTGKRVFLMAPIHHHYEKKGWAEPTIVIRFWIIAMILGLAGLATLKLR